ncbi:type II 3-dehydroquinate dehydratase [Candidatus Syntrophocurvum alkaliphilum]|nr:type II 3-dehydroquinate dehydratase [Candidatus Syntrophocurvum alkaliphilum]
MLGKREKEVYGDISLEIINEQLKKQAYELGLNIEFFQSNHEGNLIDKIHKSNNVIDFIIINPGALTHYSIALLDALKSVEIPYIEVHISNIYSRESFRHNSITATAALGGIYGLGVDSYFLALKAAYSYLIN